MRTARPDGREVYGGNRQPQFQSPQSQHVVLQVNGQNFTIQCGRQRINVSRGAFACPVCRQSFQPQIWHVQTTYNPRTGDKVTVYENLKH